MGRKSRHERAIELDVRAALLLERLREQTAAIRRHNLRALALAEQEKDPHDG